MTSSSHTFGGSQRVRRQRGDEPLLSISFGGSGTRGRWSNPEQTPTHRFTRWPFSGIHTAVYRSARLLVAALIATSLLSGCEDDECSVDLLYTVDGDGNYQHTWRNPTCTCAYGDLGAAYGEMDFEYKDASLDVTLLDASFAIGPHNVDLRFVDDTGEEWDSVGGCTALIHESETVDWVRNDHLRVTGIITCAAPLNDSDGEQLWISELKFSIYAGKAGAVGI